MFWSSGKVSSTVKTGIAHNKTVCVQCQRFLPGLVLVIATKAQLELDVGYY